MLLEVKNLNIQFKHDGETLNAVDGIDFTVFENEVLGIVGESGSGKTVTALSIMNLLPKTNCKVDGKITCNGKTAMIFQEPFTSLNPVLRVGEQIDEAVLVNKKISKEEAKDETLKALIKVKIRDPERVYNAYPHLLSGGERQRVMIAMALSLNPKLLIADEPTTALDVTIQAGILDLILELKNDLTMSVLFITHDFGIINKVADRIAVMKDGKIVERGEKKEILSSPKDDYTKKLLDAVPKIKLGTERKIIEKKDTLITIKDLNKSFSVVKGFFKKVTKKIHAVSDITLEIKKGSTLGLVGESGSGKTTLGKLIMGLLKSDSGNIDYNMRDAQIVFQDPYSSLDPRLKMQDIILEGPTIMGTSRSEKDTILRDVLFKVHLNYKNRLKYPHQFSGGQRQRIAIARALAVKPKILILDEPVSSLDVVIQSEILDLLKELQKELALTYIFISHDLRVVHYMADEVAVMQSGTIVEIAPKDKIYTSSHHPYTKTLISSIPEL